MTAQFSEAPRPLEPSTCGLCGAQVPADAERCPECRMTAGFGPGEPRPFSRIAAWGLGAVLLAVYLVTLGVVALAR